MPFYAVAKGRSTGIYHSWADCQAQVKGFSGAKFRKFDTASSANAFIQSNQGSSNGSSYNNYQSRNNNSQKRSYASSSMKYTGSTYSFLSESDSSDDEPARKRYKRDDFKKDNEEWKRNGWKSASGRSVKNQVDFKELDKVKDKVQIKWNYVKAHNGDHGNDMADKLAKAGAAMYK